MYKRYSIFKIRVCCLAKRIIDKNVKNISKQNVPFDDKIIFKQKVHN